MRLTISNTAPNAQLGSANVTFRPRSDRSVARRRSAARRAADATIDRPSNGYVVRLRNLSLPKRTGTVTFSVSLNTASSARPATNITASVKQSNDFSDAGTNPDANAFDLDPRTTLPQISLQTCNATISGQVYHDRDQSGAFAINAELTDERHPEDGLDGGPATADGCDVHDHRHRHV